MRDSFGMARTKFKHMSKEARTEFKGVKDKSLGKGLVKLIKTIKQLDKKINVIDKKVTHLIKCCR